MWYYNCFLLTPFYFSHSHQQTSSLPVPWPDLWLLVLLCDKLRLTRAICVTTGLEVSVEDWWGHQWVHSRQWCPCSLRLPVAKSWVKECRTLEPILHCAILLTGPCFCSPINIQTAMDAVTISIMAMPCPEDGILQPWSLSSCFYILPVPSFATFPKP